MLVRVVAVLWKRSYKHNSSMPVQCPVGSLFILQCQREATSEICLKYLHAYIVTIVYLYTGY